MLERINQRRRQIMVHSYLYYHLDKQLVTDETFDSWATDLVQLQRDFPEESQKVEFQREAFDDFTGETGFNLPYMSCMSTMKAAHFLLKRRGL